MQVLEKSETIVNLSTSEKEEEDANEFKNGEDLWKAMETSIKEGSISYLSFSKVTPAKVLFIARLQQLLKEGSAGAKHLRLIIYCDDILFS